MQVVPADIEAHLILHPGIVDAAVIGVLNEVSGERAQAFVVRSPSVMTDLHEEDMKESINEHVQNDLDETHWLHDRIIFLKEIPKSQSGKILKKDLKAMVIPN